MFAGQGPDAGSAELRKTLSRLAASPAIAAQIGIQYMVSPPAIDLQIALRDAFILEASPFKNPARGGVFRQACSFDTGQVKRAEGMVDQSPYRANGLPIQ